MIAIREFSVVLISPLWRRGSRRREDRAAHLLVVHLVLLEERGKHAEALLRAVGSHPEDAAEEQHASDHADQNLHPLACESAGVLVSLIKNE